MEFDTATQNMKQNFLALVLFASGCIENEIKIENEKRNYYLSYNF